MRPALAQALTRKDYAMPRSSTASRFETMADLLKDLGNISPRRIRMHPAPGTATERDVIRIHDRTDRLYELVDGVLVEKIMGYTESSLAMRLGSFLFNFAEEHDLGNVTGPDGTTRLMPRLVRIPDVSFVAWDRLPNRELPDEPIPDLAPDLAVEILSKGNTKGEMERKLREYFLAGVRVVWLVDPQTRTVQVFTASDQSVRLTEEQTLDGGDVLPGFTLPLRKLFARLPRTSDRKASRPASKRPRRKN
jgi:Uma2 family endonuclease